MAHKAVAQAEEDSRALAQSRTKKHRAKWLLVGLVAAAWGHSPAQTSQKPIRPAGIAYDAAGNLYIADAGRNEVLESSAAGVLTVVAGTGVQGFGGDGGAARAAELNQPEGIAVASDGTIYVADTGNERVRAISSSGVITTVAGTGVMAFAGDGGAATAAKLAHPLGLAVDASGALLIADSGNERVRRVSGGVITTIAGDGVQGFSGDGAMATAAQLNVPVAVAVDGNGRVLIADSHNERVRVVGTDGMIWTLAGSGVAGFAGDGRAAIAARLSRPSGVAVLPGGAVVIADADNQRVREVSAAGVISTLAGTGVQGGSGDGVAAGSANLVQPNGVAVSPFGVVAFSQPLNRSVRGVMSDSALYAAAGLESGRTSAVSLDMPATAVYGATQASVQVKGLGGAASGVVQVLDDGVEIGSGTLSSGLATVNLAMGAGSHALTVAYAGDGFHPAAVSGVANVVVSQATVMATATPANVAYGEALPVLSGTLSGVLPQDQASVQAQWKTWATVLSPVGTYPIAATLTGGASGNYSLAMSTGSGKLTIVQAGTQVSMSPVSAAYAGMPVTLSATVKPAAGGVPTGQVVFLDGGTQVASAPLVGGMASAAYLSPASGSHALTAVYGGDTDFAGSTSAVEAATVAAMPDFAITAAGSSSQTVAAGTNAVYGIDVTGQSGPFSGAISLSASGLPAGAAVEFSSSQVVPGSGTSSVTLTVPTATLLAATREHGAPQIACAVLLAALGFGLVRRGRSAALLALSGALGLIGCGTRTVNEAAVNSRSYTITVTGTGTNLLGKVVSHSAQLTLTVE